jgi:hypothetical protein
MRGRCTQDPAERATAEAIPRRVRYERHPARRHARGRSSTPPASANCRRRGPGRCEPKCAGEVRTRDLGRDRRRPCLHSISSAPETGQRTNPNDEIRMTNQARMTNDPMTKQMPGLTNVARFFFVSSFELRHSNLTRHSDFVIRHFPTRYPSFAARNNRCCGPTSFSRSLSSTTVICCNHASNSGAGRRPRSCRTYCASWKLVDW